MPTFKNIRDLNKYLESPMELFLLQAGQKIRKVIREYIQERFYNQYDPLYYDRTYQLLDSVTCTDVKKVGNKYQLEVYLNTDGVNYYNYVDGSRQSIDPQLIFEISSQGWHGATQTDGRFMEEAKQDLQNGVSYNIFEDFKKFLKSRGINVTGNISLK